MLDLIVIVFGFAAGLGAVVAINGVRRGSRPIPSAAATDGRRPAPAPAPYSPPQPAAAPPPGHGDAAAAEEQGIKVNLPGAVAPAAAAAAVAAPPPPPPAPAPPVEEPATAVAAGPSLTKASPSASPGTGARLELEDGTAAVDLVEAPVSLGRGSDQVLRIRDTRASRAHAVVRRRSKGRDGWEVADNGSANGTSLNGHVIPEGRVAPLRPGDRIGIGDTTVVYVESTGPSTPPPPAPGPDPDATQVQR